MPSANKDVDILLQPKQADLLDALEKTGRNVATILGWGGARGSAKSGGLRRIAITLASTYPGIVIYIVRRVLGDLLENHMEKIALEFPGVDALYRQGDYEYDFPNKSRIVFVYAETAIDVNRVSYGPECTFLLIDQAEQFSEDELISFRICNRWPAALPGFAKTCFFFNVGVGVGAGYLRRVFHLRQFKDNETPSEYAFTQAYGWDNYEWFRSEVPEIPEDIAERFNIPVAPVDFDAFYGLSNAIRFEIFTKHTSEGRKMNGLPKHRREGELMGSFDSFSGQYFSDVWGQHCVLTLDQIRLLVQPWWTRWMSQDWAFGEHAAHFWFVTGKVSPSEWAKMFGGSAEWPIDVAIIYREHVIEGRAEGDLAMDIVNMTPPEERKYIQDFFLSQDAMGQRARQSGENTVGQQFTAIMRRHGLPAPQSAYQDRINGWRFMYNCLRQAGLRGCNVDTERAKQGPAVFVSVDCPNAIEYIPQAPRDEKDAEDIARVPGAIWEDVTDGCLAGETLIGCEQGEIPIANVRQGMRVWTRFGLRTVKHAWMSQKSAPVFLAKFSDGSLVRATENHVFYCNGMAYRLDTMRYGDRILTWDQFDTTEEDINGPAVIINPEGHSCIGRFGARSAAKFLAGSISTIKTGMGQIIQSITWNVFHPATISGFITRDSRAKSPFQVQPQPHGILLPKESNGIGSMASIKDSGSGLRKNIIAQNVRLYFFRSIRLLDFVPTIANQLGVEIKSWITKAGLALFARIHSDPTNTKMPKHAPGNAVTFCGSSWDGMADVYDLEIEGHHEFFANGILVHNCRYGLFSKLAPRTKAPREVRALEVFQSHEDPTSRAIAMRAFAVKEAQSRVIVRRQRAR